MNNLQFQYMKEGLQVLEPIKKVKTNFVHKDSITEMIIENIPFEDFSYEESGDFKIFSTDLKMDFLDHPDETATKGDIFELIMMANQKLDASFEGVEEEYQKLTGTIEELTIVHDNHYLLKTVVDDKLKFGIREDFEVEIMESEVDGFEGKRIEAVTEDLFKDSDVLIIGDITGELNCNSHMHDIIKGLIPQIEVEYIEMSKPPQFAVLNNIPGRLEYKLNHVLEYVT